MGHESKVRERLTKEPGTRDSKELHTQGVALNPTPGLGT